MVFNYYDKYIKYKNKYLALQIQQGGNAYQRGSHSAAQEIQMYKDTALTVKNAFGTTTFTLDATGTSGTFAKRTNTTTEKLLNFAKLACVNMIKLCIEKGYMHDLFLKSEANRCEGKLETDTGPCPRYMSGAIKLNQAVFEALTVDTCETYVSANFSNIRSSFTFLDMCIKTLSDKHPLIKGVMKKFDDEIRFRDKRDGAMTRDGESQEQIPEHIKNNDLSQFSYRFDQDGVLTRFTDNIPAYARNDLAIKLLAFPGATYKTPADNDFVYVIAEHLIESYSDKEIAGYTLPPAMIGVGANIFKEPGTKTHPATSSLGAFVAGISGHTMDMMLLFSLFFTETKAGVLDFKLQYHIVSACLVWMQPYYHHSYREIVALLNIYCPGNIVQEEIYDLFAPNSTIISVIDKYNAKDATATDPKPVYTFCSKPGQAPITSTSQLHTADIHRYLINKITTKLVTEINNYSTTVMFVDPRLFGGSGLNTIITEKIPMITTFLEAFKTTNKITTPRPYLRLP
jgi:hypothetical protein